MHLSSFENMRFFSEKYLDKERKLRILDLGSQEVEGETNGSYRPIFENPNWTYEGADVVPGKNVDIILSSPYRWTNIKSKSYDVVACGQMFEHDEFFWLTMLEIRRILKPEALCCIIAPSMGPEHRYPLDCYRYYPDGLRAAAAYADMEVIETYAQWNRVDYPDMDPMWRDCVAVIRRPQSDFFREIGISIERRLLTLGSKRAIYRQYADDYSNETNWEFPQQKSVSNHGRFFFGAGSGFSNQGSVVFPVRSGEPLQLRFDIPENCKRLRFDPVEGCGCVVTGLVAETDRGVCGFRPVNGELMGDRVLFLDTEDPQIYLTGEAVADGHWVNISCKVIVFSKKEREPQLSSGESVSEKGELPNCEVAEAQKSELGWIGFHGIYPSFAGNKISADRTVTVKNNQQHLTFKGWAADFVQTAPLSALYLEAGNDVYSCEYGLYRDDVAEHFGIPSLVAIGFSVTIPALAGGRKTEVRFHMVSADGKYRYPPEAFTLVHE